MSSAMTYGRLAGTQVTAADGHELTFLPLGGSFGATVVGVDLSGNLSEPVKDELRRAFTAYGALRFAKQRLAPDDELRALRIFSDVAPMLTPWRHPEGFPQILILSNIIAENGEPVGVANKKGMEWHVDNSGCGADGLASSLYAIEVPETGGETYFANGYLAFETLPASERERLLSMIARYSSLTLRKYLMEATGEEAPPEMEEDKAPYPDVFRPLVKTHPVTGRKALHFTIEEIASIDDMTNMETRELLNGLIHHMTSTPHIVYRHDWTPGDAFIWDNRCIIHSTSEYNYAGQRRLMHQITGKDFAPTE